MKEDNVTTESIPTAPAKEPTCRWCKSYLGNGVFCAENYAVRLGSDSPHCHGLFKRADDGFTAAVTEGAIAPEDCNADEPVELRACPECAPAPDDDSVVVGTMVQALNDERLDELATQLLGTTIELKHAYRDRIHDFVARYIDSSRERNEFRTLIDEYAMTCVRVEQLSGDAS